MHFNLFLLIVGAVLYYRIGVYEYGSGVSLAGISLVFGFLALYVLDWGRFGYLGGQGVLFALLTWYNYRRLFRHRTKPGR